LKLIKKKNDNEKKNENENELKSERIKSKI